MTNVDPGVPEYEFEWQNPNPNTKNFDFGRTFSRAIDILKARGVKMCILTALLMGIPLILVSLWPLFMSGTFEDLIGSDDPSAFKDIFSGGMIIIFAVGGILTFIASLWVQPALIQISYSALINEDLPSMTILKRVTRFVLPVFGFYILYFLAVMFGMILLIIPGLLVALGWMLAGHIIVLEGQGVMDSISRAWALTKGSKRWLLLLGFVFGVIGAIVGAVVSIPLYLFADPNVALFEGASAPYWIMNALASTIGQVVGTVIGVAWTTSAYVEIRKIREGVDPESQADIFS